jgi:hypothetical protein
MRVKRGKSGDAVGRASWRSSFLGDPGAKFLCGKLEISTKKEKRSKKERREGLWKLTPLLEIRKERGFPPRLENSLANGARLFHSSHRPNNNHHLNTFSRQRSTSRRLNFCVKKFMIKETGEPKITNPTSSKINLLQQKNGLDFGVHRKAKNQRAMKFSPETAQVWPSTHFGGNRVIKQGRKSLSLWGGRVLGSRWFDPIAEVSELPDHSRSAPLLRFFGDGWAPFFVTNCLV